MGKYLKATVTAIILLTFASPASAAANPFIDVPINHWSYDAIGQLAACGVLSGYPDGTYKGKQPTTRYEMASALARALAFVDMTKASVQDVEMLKRLLVEFRDELDALGIRVENIDKRLGTIEDRLGGWKLGGSIRFDLFHATTPSNVDVEGTAFARTRLEIQRWFGEDKEMHLYIRVNDAESRWGADAGSIRWSRFYVEVPAWWDTTLTVGRFSWDKEAAYYLQPGNLTENMGWGLASILTDRPLDGLGITKNFRLGKVSAYLANSNLASIVFGRETGISSTADFGAWEFFAMGEFQFTERFGLDLGVQYLHGDDSSTLKATGADDVAHNLDFDMLYTIFGGIRFDFSPNIAFRGIYYYQDSDYSIDGVDVENAYTDGRSAFRVLVDVKQDLFKFTNLWLAYDHLEQGFATPNGYSLILSGLDGRSLVGTSDHTTIGSLMRDDMSIWRLGARQRWNDKWTTFGYVADHSFDNLDANVLQWAVGVVYKYNPSVQFGLVYSHNDVDDALQTDPNFKDPSVIRFRTFIAF
jgi:hypothetical protein